VGNRLAAAFLALAALIGAWPAAAEPVYAKIPAHPALWTVHGPKGTAYLFGSIHFLPPQIDWHTKDIDAAMAKADVMVFELAMDDDFVHRVQSTILAHGMLPQGQHLHEMLSPEAAQALDRQVAQAGVAPESIDRMRPWLAQMTLELSAITKQNFSAQSGVEMQIEKPGEKSAKPVIGLETVEQQMALMVPDDPKVELQSFESSLKSGGGPAQGKEEMGPMLDAWIHGNARELARLDDKALDGYPEARKALFDDRNKAWVTKLGDLLAEDKTYFVTVGVGHLVGAQGVPALLRAKGYRVDGP
jgi:uncharacterized protein